MPHVVPRTVVDFIDHVLPNVRTQQRDTIGMTLERAHVSIVAAIVNMVDQIPEELLPSDAMRYTELLAALSALRAAIGMWQNQGSTFTLVNFAYGYNAIS